MNTSNLMTLAFRLLRRDWRAGEIRVLLAALIVAVTCVTSVTFFTDRIRQALDYQASELLAADLRVYSDHPLDEKYLKKARSLSLQVAQTVTFRSMSVSATTHHLAEVKAVSGKYPLRGALKISTQPFAQGEVTKQVPEPGTIWVNPRLLTQLQVQLYESVTLGGKSFKISHFLMYEPDRSGDMFSIAPRILMNLEDLEATGLIQEGSRMRYRLLVAGDRQQVTAYRSWVNDELGHGEKVEDIRDARQEVRSALERGERFLGLSAIVSVILSCIAVAMSARRYAARHMDSCAILRCFGARQGQISRLFMVQLVIIGIVASMVGCLLGYLAHLVLYQLASQLFVVSLPAASLWPLVSGIVVCLIGLLGFALPPVIRLREVSTMQVLRKEFGRVSTVTLSSYSFGVILLALLVLWQSQSIKLGLLVLGGVIATSAVLALFAWYLIIVLNKWVSGRNISWRLSITHIVRRRAASVTQILAFGIGIMVLLLLGFVRTDLLAAWQESLPDDASNRFVINIQPDQLKEVTGFFNDRKLGHIKLYPMVRARLTKINGNAVDVESLEEGRPRRLATREFNLSWAEELQTDNKIVNGKWWGNNANPAPAFSVEQGIAESLKLIVNDELTYEIAGEEVTGGITSIRTVRWDTFRPNFFVIASPGLLDGYPASYITSFYLPSDRSVVLDELIRQFPNLTVVDISIIMQQVRNIISRITLTVESVFVFTLLAGLAVLYAAIQSTLDERIRENAILRAVGASKKRLLKGIIGEFAILGGIAGLLAAFCASVAGYVLATQVFDLQFQLNFWLWAVGFSAGAIGVGLAGIIGTRKALITPPLPVIRGGQ